MKGTVGLEELEERLTKLERRVMGNSDPDECQQPVVESLTSVHNKIQSSLGGKDKISSGLMKVHELEKVLDMEETDRITLSEAAKLEFVLAEEDRIRNTLDSFQKIEDLKYILDSEHIKGTASQIDKLMNLSQVQLAQQKHAEDVTAEVQNLLCQYNDIVSTMTKQFVLWDDMLTKFEIASQPKKILE